MENEEEKKREYTLCVRIENNIKFVKNGFIKMTNSTIIFHLE